MLTQMCVDFTKLNAESTDLNLIIRTSRALHNTIGEVSPKVSRAIHAIADAFPVPRLNTSEEALWVQNRVLPWGRTGREPVVDELLLAGVLVEVAFSQPTRADVYLPDLSYGAWDISVVPVDNEELDVDHTFTGWHNIFLRGEECGILGHWRDGKVGYCTLGLCSSIHVDNPYIGRESLKAKAVTLGEDVADEEGVEESWNLARSLCRKQLTHGGGEMGYGDLTRGHPLSQPARGTNVIRSWDV
jgi:hypothetical protein